MNSGMEQRAQRLYRLETLKALSPRERLLIACDLAWKAANEGDGNRLRQLLIMLRMGINFEKDPLQALNILRLYRHCEEAVEREDYPEISRIMFILKRALPGMRPKPEGPDAEACRRKVRESGGQLMFGRGKKYSFGRARYRGTPAAPVAEDKEPEL